MHSAFQHETVLLEETVAALQPTGDSVILDGTLGGGGHTRLWLERSGPSGRVIAIDQDERAIRHAQQWGAAYGDRLQVVRANFEDAGSVLRELGVDAVDGILLDLGVSSPQLDEAQRGFSYQHDAPLDMRMDRRMETTAADLLRDRTERELTVLFRDYGEEKWAARIASFVVRERGQRPVETTGQLVDLIKAAIPAAARREGGHPAKRVFQALRIAVNGELSVLERFLQEAPDLLRVGGRMAVISFHSLEDRIVKQAYANAAKTCVCPPQQPMCTCNKRQTLRVLTRKPIEPSDAELERNQRARSAKLRVAERV
ncbi:MAG: 16S rRNA (cytosine(1402)-N(4))-methyltransferase RsmH [Firmicutes bacterium]|nr:16S rRNA (cytosine(1402)-N(4))-methyltransferase RsmH [Bacillota bacterium]